MNQIESLAPGLLGKRLEVPSNPSNPEATDDVSIDMDIQKLDLVLCEIKKDIIKFPSQIADKLRKIESLHKILDCLDFKGDQMLSQER